MKTYTEIIKEKFAKELEYIEEFSYERNLQFTNLDSYIKATNDVLHVRPSPWLEHIHYIQLTGFLNWLINYSNQYEIELKYV